MPQTPRSPSLLHPPTIPAPDTALIPQLLHWELGQWRLNKWSRLNNCQEVVSDATWKHHFNTVRGLAVSRDGSILVSVADDKKLAICDTKTGSLTHRLKGHTREVNCVVLTPDGHTVISGSWDATIRVWSLDA